MFHGDVTTARAAAWRDSLLMDHAVFRLAWDNFDVVVPGKLYRANHPTPGRVARYRRELGLRTIINLRGPRASGSDALSRDAARRLRLAHIDMAFESRGAPHRDRILRFAEIWRTLNAPALIHCKSGADRAGLAAGLVVLFEGGTAAEALRHLSWRYGHFPHSKTGILDAFFRLYAARAEGRMPFLDWVDREYHEQILRDSFRPRRFSAFINDRLLARE